jgi:hypothetical protein
MLPAAAGSALTRYFGGVHIVSTIAAAESTRFSTKLTLRSACRCRLGTGGAGSEAEHFVLRGFCRCSAGRASCGCGSGIFIGGGCLNPSFTLVQFAERKVSLRGGSTVVGGAEKVSDAEEVTEVATEEVVVAEKPDDDEDDVEVEATEGVGD